MLIYDILKKRPISIYLLGKSRFWIKWCNILNVRFDVPRQVNLDWNDRNGFFQIIQFESMDNLISTEKMISKKVKIWAIKKTIKFMPFKFNK